MTSKISFHKMIQSELRQNAWLPVLISVAALFLYPVGCLIVLQNCRRGFYPGIPKTEIAERNLQAVSSVLGSGNPLTVAAVLAAALLAACVMFSFLDSREKTDFYQSLALKREKAFLVHYLAGWLAVVIPYLAAVLLSLFGIGAVYGAVTADAVRVVFTCMARAVLGFSAVYSLSVLATVLAGRVLIGVLLMLCFLLYGPAFSLLLYGMTSEFFPSIGGTLADGGLNVSLWLSPFTLLIRTFGLSCVEENGALSAASWLVLAGYLAGAFLAAWWLYCRRPSEAAGNAFSFPIMEPILKVAVTVPASVGAGLMLGVLAGTGTGKGSVPAVVVFTLLLACIINGILEFIFHVDLKSIRKHWRSFTAALAFCAGVLTFFAADPFQIDSWFPAEEKIEAMAVYVPASLNDFGTVLVQSDVNLHSILQESLTENFDPVYQTLRKRQKGQESSDSEYTTSVQTAFKMKNGSIHYRYYEIPASEAAAMLDRLGEDKTWREEYYPANQLDVSRYTDVTLEGWLTGNYEQTGETLSGKEDVQNLAACIRRDTNQMSYQELREATPLLLATFEDNREDASGTVSDGQSFYIYPGFSETLQYLGSRGVDVEKLGKTGFSADQVIKVVLNVTEETEDGEDPYRSYQLTDNGQIEDLLACTEPAKESGWYAGTEAQSDASFTCQDGDYWTCLRITDPKKYDTLLQSLDKEGDGTNAE